MKDSAEGLRRRASERATAPSFASPASLAVGDDHALQVRPNRFGAHVASTLGSASAPIACALKCGPALGRTGASQLVAAARLARRKWAQVYVRAVPLLGG